MGAFGSYRPLIGSIGVIIGSLVLAACANQPRVEIVKPPLALTSCADEPVAPALPGREQQAERDRLTLDYIVGLRSAWGDCRAKVDGVRAWSEGLGE